MKELWLPLPALAPRLQVRFVDAKYGQRRFGDEFITSLTDLSSNLRRIPTWGDLELTDLLLEAPREGMVPDAVGRCIRGCGRAVRCIRTCLTCMGLPEESEDAIEEDPLEEPLIEADEQLPDEDVILSLIHI